ncbi:uncharacterized protein LOC128219092 [Mya arenaria]|uniref:uncharacterized protein LOC128219092 n=1 Tax=Mya arenaria TaxID=6604 RepID=UPI0022E7CBE6|nr:uncharacterized protein LOC128219092 [Mya arenaria]
MSTLNTPMMSAQTKPFISSLGSCSLTNTESISSAFGASTTSEESKTSALGVLNSSADSQPSLVGELNLSADSKPSAFGALNSSADSKPSAFGTMNSSADSKPLAFGALNSSADSRTSAFGAMNSSAESKPLLFGTLNTSEESKPSLFGTYNSSAESKPPALGALNSLADSGPSAFGALNSSAESKPSAFGTLNTSTESKPSLLGTLNTSAESKPSLLGTLNTSTESKPSLLGTLNTSTESKPSIFGTLNTSTESKPSLLDTLNTSAESKASSSWRTVTESKRLPFGTTTLSVESKASFFESSRKPVESKPFVFGSLATSTDDKSLGSSSMMIPVSSFGTLSTTAESQPFGSLGSSTTSVFPEIVSISTGEGGFFTVPLALLTKEKGSTLAAMFEGHSPLRKLPDGTFYIDVDKESFQEIMDFLRYNLHPQICRAGEKGFSKRRILKLFKAAEKLGLYKLMSIIKQLEPVQHYLELNDKDIVDSVGLVLSRLDRRELKRSGHFSIRLDCIRRCFDDLKNSCAHDCDINIFNAKIYLKDVESHTLEMICCSLKEKGFDVEGVEIFCDFVCNEHSKKQRNKPCCSRISHIVNFFCNDVSVKIQPSSLFVLMNKKEGNHSSAEKQTELQCTTTSTQTELKQPRLDRTENQAVDVYEYSPGNEDSGVFLKNSEEPWA